MNTVVVVLIKRLTYSYENSHPPARGGKDKGQRRGQKAKKFKFIKFKNTRVS